MIIAKEIVAQMEIEPAFQEKNVLFIEKSNLMKMLMMR